MPKQKKGENLEVWINKKRGHGAVLETLYLWPGGCGFELASLQNLKRNLKHVAH
jgi:hypothetical protein